ncbi:MAG: mannose-6-phosphate isomerase [Gaiellales bacterium]|nr:mannose-6-phosphate isomerase [Gaiellales bacterium]
MRPYRLPQTRVYRFYRGGALLERFRGGRGEDSDHPEDWVGSVTKANNPGRDEHEAGLSRLEDGRLLADAIREDPRGWLGGAAESGSTGVLVKLLDSAQRLPVHAHPDRAFAQKHFRSPFGKTEAWIVLATREESSDVWIGQLEDVDPAEYREWIDRQDTDRLLHSLNRVPVTAGDVIYVPAGVPHAIGAGVLIAELQEPTDFSIVCEWEGFPIEPADSHLGIGWDTALGALDLRRHEPVRELPDEARSFFWADEAPEPAGRFAVWMVLDGHGTVAGLPVSPGDCLAVPAGAREIQVEGDLRVLRCVGPDQAPPTLPT